jgi:hypothetical protein
MDHEKKKTPIANKEKDQNKVLPEKKQTKKQKNDEEETDNKDNELFEKKLISWSPGIAKEKGMHDIKDEVQAIKGTHEKKICGWGENRY